MSSSNAPPASTAGAPAGNAPSATGADASAPALAMPGSGVGDAASRKSPLLKKQRILWDSDAATRGGKTSITVLLEWLASPGNYNRWRAGKSQYGETREALCTQIKAEMKKHGILHRENANIRTQISELERSYDTAVAWLVQNGYDGKIPDASAVNVSELPPGLEGTAESSNPVEAYVLRTCRYFHAMDTIIRSSLTTSLSSSSSSSSSSLSPAATSVSRKRPRYSRALLKKPAAGDEDRQHGDSDGASGEKAAEVSVAVPASAAEEATPSTISPTESRTDEPAATVALASRAAERRPPVLLSQKRKSESPTSVGASISTTSSSINSEVGVIVSVPAAVPAAADPTISGSAVAQPLPSAALLETSLTAYENTQRVVFEAAREERDRKRFLMEEEKCKLECEKLRFEVQAAKLKLKVERALAKKQLAGAGLSQTEIDALVET